MADDPRYPNDPNAPHARAERTGERSLPQPEESDPSHRLPWPGGTDPAQVGNAFAQGETREQHELADTFERRNDSSGREERQELAREFAAPHSAQDQHLARRFEDPNATDDIRLGKSFEEQNF